MGRTSAGFTLIELLIVIVIIATLSIIVSLALNPAKRLQDARDAKRVSDVNTLWTAINAYNVDKASLPTGLTASMTETQIGTCTLGVAPAITSGGCNIPAGKACIDLSGPLAPYLKTIPKDPKTGTAAQTLYSVSVDSNSIVTINACGTEGSQTSSTPTPAPTATPTPTMTPTPPAGTPTPMPPAYFAVAAGTSSGFNDNVVRQLVRTDSDKLYIFAAAAQYNTTLKAYWTNSTGLPTSTASFNGTTQMSETAHIISTEVIYGGGTIIHVLTNLQNGQLKDHPFDTATNTFKSALTISSGNPTLPSDYIGSQGVSGAFDTTGKLHLAYWSSSNHITYASYTYNAGTNTLTLVNGPTQIDTSGPANHPAIAISPLDNSVTIAWVSQATTPARILARTSADGTSWGTVQQVSATVNGDPWVSDNFGKNIDQGPSLVISTDGTKRILYMETYDGTGDYGRMHVSSTTGTTWTNQETNFYSHAAALAINSTGEIYMLGHGHPNNSGSCTSMTNHICTVKRNTDGTWATPQIFATASGGENLDGSESVKWSAVSWNRPETIEFLFFEFNSFKLYYAHL